MITIVIHNLYDKTERHYDINKMYDFDQLIADFGHHISAIVSQFKSVRPAADAVAEYLSNHHLQVEIIDPEDSEMLYDPNVPENGPQQSIKNAADLKDVLENFEHIETVDIPEYHVFANEMARPDESLLKSENLAKDRGRITFPADPKITNRPDQNVARIGIDTSIPTVIGVGRNRINDALGSASKDIDPNLVTAKLKDSLSDTSTTGHTWRINDQDPVSFISATSDIPTKEHEGFHNLISNIKNKHGQSTADDFLSHVWNHIPEHIQENLGHWLVNIGYPSITKNPSQHKEEVIAHIRDLLHSSKDRNAYQAHSSQHNNNPINDIELKRAWKAVQQSAAKYTLPIHKSENNPIYDFLFADVFTDLSKG